jgi:hypothetical protein
LDEGPHIDINFDKAATEDKSLLLTVFNPSYTYSPLVDAARIKTVPLWYRELGDRELGDAGWHYALDKDGEKVEFSNGENEYGYATAKWNYKPIGDGVYELKAETICHIIPGAPKEFNSFSDSPITVVIDLWGPKLHGLPTPNNGILLWPGDEVTFAFSEPVLCEKPYRFAFSVTVEGQVHGGAANRARVFDNDDLSIVCDRNEIRFSFDQTNVDLNELNGKAVSMVLSGVQDVVGNYYGVLLDDGTLIDNKIIHAVQHATINATEASVWFEADMTYPECPTNKDVMRGGVAAYIGMDQQIIVVKSVSCSEHVTDEVMVTVIYKITSKTQLEISTRRLAADELDIVSVPHLARKLMDASSSQDTSLLRVRNLRIVLGESDQRRRAEDLMTRQAALDSTKLDSSDGVVFGQLRLIHQKQEENRLQQEEDREMLKSVMQMLQQKQSNGMKQEEAPHNSILFLVLASLLGVIAVCLVMWTVGNGRKEKQDVEASIL